VVETNGHPKKLDSNNMKHNFLLLLLFSAKFRILRKCMVKIQFIYNNG